MNKLALDVDLSEPDVVLEPDVAPPPKKPRTKARTKRKPAKHSLPEALASGLDDLDIPEPTKPQALPVRLWSKVVSVVRDAIRKPRWFKRKFGSQT